MNYCPGTDKRRIFGGWWGAPAPHTPTFCVGLLPPSPHPTHPTPPHPTPPHLTHPTPPHPLNPKP